MKNILKLSLIVGALFFTINISAKDRVFSISLVDVSSKVLKFEVMNAENVSLDFYNDRKDEIYSENLGNRAIVEKTYDLSTLSTGEYFLVAESEFKIEKYRVIIDKDGNVKAEKTPVLALNKPEYTIENNIVKLYMNNVENGVNVSISDLANNEYYNQTVNTKNGEINLKFDFNANNSAAYVISVAKDGAVFNRLITLK
ncbi:hypothetical protein [Epilithonimonas hominis]|uniref:hypothetical protein n=1 Tax=Epilithonimonas hominis TaxID=420404 RepID=UPI00289FAF3D|nr:hypothetical protein [Epilithonimonas hominis]